MEVNYFAQIWSILEAKFGENPFVKKHCLLLFSGEIEAS